MLGEWRRGPAGTSRARLDKRRTSDSHQSPETPKPPHRFISFALLAVGLDECISYGVGINAARERCCEPVGNYICTKYLVITYDDLF